MNKTIRFNQPSVILAIGLILFLFLPGCAHNKQIQPIASETPTAPQAAAEVTSADGQRSEANKDKDSFPDEEVLEEDGDFFEDEFSNEAALVADPLAPVNRAIFTFNDKLITWGLKPIAKGYRKVVPEPIRLGVGNFISNVAGIGRIANCLLQGKIRDAGGEFGRFFINTTAGLLGIGNPAANYPKLNPPKEDMGQTLGRYGVGEGIYIVLPIFGPSTLRDTIGLVGDAFLNPFAYLDPWYISPGVRALKMTNDFSFRIGDYEALKSSALDPYLLFQSGYIQKRRQMVKQ